MSETFYFGLTSGEVKRLFSDVVFSEGSVASAITFLLNRDKKLDRKYRFRSLAQCEVWKVDMIPARDTLTTLSQALFMLDTYVRFNRLDSRSAALEELLLGVECNRTGEAVKGIERSCQTQFRCSLLQKIPSCNKLTQTPAPKPKSVNSVAVQNKTEASDMTTQTEVSLVPRCNEFVQIGGPLFGQLQEATQGNARHYTISTKKNDSKSAKKKRNQTQAKHLPGMDVASYMQMTPPFSSCQESRGSMSQTCAQPQAGNMVFYRPPFPRGQFVAFPFTHPPVPSTNFPAPNYQGAVIPTHQSNITTHSHLSNGKCASLCNAGRVAADAIKIADLDDSLTKANNGIDLVRKKCAAVSNATEFSTVVPVNDVSYTIRKKKLKLDSVLYPNGDGVVKCESLIKDATSATIKQANTMCTATAFLSKANSAKIENGGTFSNPVSRNNIDLEASTSAIIGKDTKVRFCKKNL